MTAVVSRPQSVSSMPKSPRQQPALSKSDLAQQSVAAKPSSSPAAVEGPLMSPSLDSILKAFQAQGNEDKEMLKLLLQAKAKEDERLAALDAFRAEQLRAANTLAMQQYFYQYQQIYAVAAIAQQQQAAALKGPPPYSPTSPPPSTLAPSTNGTKRPRAPSDASSTASSSSSIDSSKKAKTSASGHSPSHEEVMVQLRRKLERNRSPGMQANPLPATSQPGYFPQQQQPRLIAPRTSLSPPLAGATTTTTTTTGRRNSPPHIPGRHTSLLRAAAAPSSTSTSPSPGPGSPPLPPVAEEQVPLHQHQQSTPRNRLELLLHASESTEVASPAWQPAKPTVLAATSDCRGEA